VCSVAVFILLALQHGKLLLGGKRKGVEKLLVVLIKKGSKTRKYGENYTSSGFISVLFLE
jgi:hypothetical protein